jgi:hypothetical protein
MIRSAPLASEDQNVLEEPLDLAPFRLASPVALALAPAVTTASPAAEALGAFDDHGDVGSPRLAGSAVYNGFSQEYTLSVAGVNLWEARDEFHFVWKRLRGDFVLQVCVELVGKGVD